MNAQALPSEKDTTNNHDGSDEETCDDESDADGNEAHADEHLLPPLCVQHEPTNDHQDPAVHFTSINSAVHAVIANSLRP